MSTWSGRRRWFWDRDWRRVPHRFGSSCRGTGSFHEDDTSLIKQPRSVTKSDHWWSFWKTRVEIFWFDHGTWVLPCSREREMWEAWVVHHRIMKEFKPIMSTAQVKTFAVLVKELSPYMYKNIGDAYDSVKKTFDPTLRDLPGWIDVEKSMSISKTWFAADVIEREDYQTSNWSRAMTLGC